MPKCVGSVFRFRAVAVWETVSARRPSHEASTRALQEVFDNRLCHYGNLKRDNGVVGIIYALVLI